MNGYYGNNQTYYNPENTSQNGQMNNGMYNSYSNTNPGSYPYNYQTQYQENNDHNQLQNNLPPTNTYNQDNSGQQMYYNYQQDYSAQQQNQGYQPPVNNVQNTNYSGQSPHNVVTPKPLTTNPSLLPPTVKSQSVYQSPGVPQQVIDGMRNMNVSQGPEDAVDLMQNRNLFSSDIMEDVTQIPTTHYPSNCDPSVMQSTLNAIPVDQNLLAKCRLPLGIHVQPFRDAQEVHLITTSTIVRCRSCRTYINPFVALTDQQRRWHCNVCDRVNDLPDEFMYDPVTKAYASPSKRPELVHANIEYTANPEYTVRPPMPATYVLCLDVSRGALVDSGHLEHSCRILADCLDSLPGDRRARLAVITYSTSVHFYQLQSNSLSEAASFKMLSWPDTNGPAELPCCTEDLLVPLKERRELLRELLESLPEMHPMESAETGNCMGYVIQVCMKMIGNNGGRVTLFNASLPSVGPGSLKPRGDPMASDPGTTKAQLSPADDFYKTTALQCVNDQISMDLFSLGCSGGYHDLASTTSLCRHSSGSFHHYGGLKASSGSSNLSAVAQLDLDRFQQDLRRYLTRPIGFEAVMRTRCTKDLEITAFHGNLFMRSTDVIALPVVNPDVSYAIQFKHRASLSNYNYIIIQSALLYTTSNSERRIRVATLCLPVTDKVETVFSHSNGTAIAGLLARLALDRVVSDGLACVREAFVNSLVDPVRAYNSVTRGGGGRALLVPHRLRFLAPLVLGLVRLPAFRTGLHIDERVAVIETLRSLPLTDCLRRVYPMMLPLHGLLDSLSLAQLAVTTAAEFPRPLRLGLCSANITRDGVYLLDVGNAFLVVVGAATPASLTRRLCTASDSGSSSIVLQDISITSTDPLRSRLAHLCLESGNFRSLGTSVVLVTPSESGPLRSRVVRHLVEDRLEDALSYFEFLRSVHSAVYSS